MNKNIFKKSLLSILVFSLFSTEVLSKTLEVVFPSSIHKDIRTDYLVSVLKLALDKSKIDYTLKASGIEMTHSRKMMSVENGSISIIWTAASTKTQKKLDAIKIPIYGGLMGYRVFIINKNIQSKLSLVKDLTDLHSFSIGQGIGWGDVSILKNAGFKVVVAKYNSLFKMVNLKRFDLFSRGIQEAYAEVESHKKTLPSLVVEKDLGIHYPKAVFFYVKKGNKDLKDALTIGLDRAYEDGSFVKLFKNHPYIKTALTSANMESRSWFEIKNPSFDKKDEILVQKYFDKITFAK